MTGDKTLNSLKIYTAYDGRQNIELTENTAYDGRQNIELTENTAYDKRHYLGHLNKRRWRKIMEEQAEVSGSLSQVV